MNINSIRSIMYEHVHEHEQNTAQLRWPRTYEVILQLRVYVYMYMYTAVHEQVKQRFIKVQTCRCTCTNLSDQKSKHWRHSHHDPVVTM